MNIRSAGKTAAARGRAVQVAAAVAREAVLSLHVEHALGLIRQAAGRVSELRMLEVYLRLLELSGPAAETVATRVLAALGRSQEEADAAAPAPPVAVDPTPDPAATGEDISLLRTLRRRLRGRVHDELRRQVELGVGVAKTALLHTHVAHARGMVALLADTHEIAEACARYTALVEVPSAHAAVLYTLVLDRIAAEQRNGVLAPAPADTAVPAVRAVIPAVRDEPLPPAASLPREANLPRRPGQRGAARARSSA